MTVLAIDRRMLHYPQLVGGNISPGPLVRVNRSVITNPYACFIGTGAWLEINGKKYQLQYTASAAYLGSPFGGYGAQSQANNVLPGNHPLFTAAALDPVSFLVIGRRDSGTGTVVIAQVGGTNDYITVQRANSSNLFPTGVVTSGGTGTDYTFFNTTVAVNDVSANSACLSGTSVRIRHLNYTSRATGVTTQTVGTMQTPNAGLSINNTCPPLFVLFERRCWTPEEQDSFTRDPYQVLIAA